jgi:hypothetical protein
MIVPFPAGGATDVIARIMAERMRGPLGQPIIIENIGGADRSVGVGRTARARPDGYTICLGIDGTFVLNAGFYSLPYDVLNDFVPISPLATGPTILAGRKTMPAKDLSELIPWLKAHPNEASIGMNTLGFRSPAHVAGELFQDDGRCQSRSRAVSWNRSRIDRSAWRTGLSLVRQHAHGHRIYQGRQGATIGGDKRNALGGPVRYPKHGRIPSGLWTRLRHRRDGPGADVRGTAPGTVQRSL